MSQIKFAFRIFILLFSIQIKCQDNVLRTFQNSEIVSEELLTNEEAIFISDLFSKENINYDFKNKKVGFISGSSGTKKENKNSYFKFIKSQDSNKNIGGLVIFNDKEKEETGYDCVVIYWSKIWPSKKSTIRTLKRNKS